LIWTSKFKFSFRGLHYSLVSPRTRKQHFSIKLTCSYTDLQLNFSSWRSLQSVKLWTTGVRSCDSMEHIGQIQLGAGVDVIVW